MQVNGPFSNLFWFPSVYDEAMENELVSYVHFYSWTDVLLVEIVGRLL